MKKKEKKRQGKKIRKRFTCFDTKTTKQIVVLCFFFLRKKNQKTKIKETNSYLHLKVQVRVNEENQSYHPNSCRCFVAKLKPVEVQFLRRGRTRS